MFRFEQKKLGENKRINKALQEAQQEFDESVGAAQSCLQNKDFKRYAELYKKCEKRTISILMELSAHNSIYHDPVHFGFVCSSILERLKALRILLEQVNSDAGKEI